MTRCVCFDTIFMYEVWLGGVPLDLLWAFLAWSGLKNIMNVIVNTAQLRD